MGCPFKDNEQKCKKAGKCILGVFLTILGAAVALKIITLILCILPGSSHDNTWLVVVATLLVLYACKKYKNKTVGCCGSDCHCACHDNVECCDKSKKDDSKTSQTKE
jgi:hypothetical protein